MRSSYQCSDHQLGIVKIATRVMIQRSNHITGIINLYEFSSMTHLTTKVAPLNFKHIVIGSELILPPTNWWMKRVILAIIWSFWVFYFKEKLLYISMFSLPINIRNLEQNNVSTEIEDGEIATRTIVSVSTYPGPRHIHWLGFI